MIPAVSEPWQPPSSSPTLGSSQATAASRFAHDNFYNIAVFSIKILPHSAVKSAEVNSKLNSIRRAYIDCFTSGPSPVQKLAFLFHQQLRVLQAAAFKHLRFLWVHKEIYITLCTGKDPEAAGNYFGHSGTGSERNSKPTQRRKREALSITHSCSLGMHSAPKWSNCSRAAATSSCPREQEKT